MKAQELRQLIREEVRKTLSEAEGLYTVIDLWDKIDGKFRVKAVPAGTADEALLSYLKQDSKYTDYGAEEAIKYIKKSSGLVQDGDIVMYRGKGTFTPDYIITKGQVDRKAALQILKAKVFNR